MNMNRVRTSWLIVIFVSGILGAVLTSRAGDRSGTVSGQFLKIGTSARAIGMGGAQVAVAEGVSSMGFNPAGIMVVGDMGFGATYTAWLASIQHSFAGFVKNVPGLGAFGVSVILLTTDDIQE